MKYIADIGSNHNQDYKRLYELIDVAKSIGCTAVKLQMFDGRLGRTPEDKHRLEATKTSEDLISRTYHKCKDLGLFFHCTPFHPDFVHFLNPYVDEFKIGSYELLWLDLIEECAKTRKPLCISTGNGTPIEIENAFIKARTFLPPELISMYHCIPHYPANPKFNSLFKILQLHHTFPDSPIGYSDHTVDTEIVVEAVNIGVQEIEFHLDLEDEKGNEYKHGHCWTPSKAALMIETSKNKTSDNFLQCIKMRKGRTNPKDGMRGMEE